MNRILITGANGCIGNVLVRSLVYSGYEVTALVLDSSDKSRISDLDGIDIVFGDICNQSAMGALLERCRFDAVVHLAAVVHQPHAEKEEFMRVNYEATINLFELSQIHMVRHFIFISTVAISGEEVEQGGNEETTPNPQTPYAISKLKAEEYLKQNQNQSIHYTIIRPSTVYGRYDKGNIKKLLDIAKKGIVPVIGSGKNLKSLVYVENLVEGVLQTILNERAFNQCFILSDERPYSVNELLATMQQVIEKRIIIIHLPPKAIFPVLEFLNSISGMFANKEVFAISSIKKLATNNVFDISKARRVLNYEPKYTLFEGLKKAYSDFNPALVLDGKTHF